MLDREEWYKLYRYIPMKEARRYLSSRVVSCEDNGRKRYALVAENGDLLGRVDPKHRWVRRMIIAQEDEESTREMAEVNDRGVDPGESGERPEGWTPAG